MFKGITIGQYYPGDSFFHRLEPRIKIGLITAYVVSLFLLDTGWGYLIMTLATLSVIAIARLPFKLLLRGLRPLYFIIAFTLLLHIFFTKGGRVPWGPVPWKPRASTPACSWPGVGAAGHHFFAADPHHFAHCPHRRHREY